MLFLIPKSLRTVIQVLYYRGKQPMGEFYDTLSFVRRCNEQLSYVTAISGFNGMFP